ncbi:BA75_02880T0 [Komagataella pastoris]|uniref:BA75_02880T0 n=1 Tax=Komagataella pastoris TaxID=4922 RepID=A0A1B2JC68_PICPA|nr:BA75_02880T0 [Komagataella pastoris]
MYLPALRLACCILFSLGTTEALEALERELFALKLDKSWLPSFLESFQDKFRYERQINGLDDYHVFSHSKSEEFQLEDFKVNSLLTRDNANIHSELTSYNVDEIHILRPSHYLHKRAPVVVDKSEELREQIAKDFDIDDPLFPKQWHLFNPRYPGHDVNVSQVWYDGITGRGVVTAIVDDGLDMDSKDLKESFCEEGSWDFNANTRLPKPRLRDDHHGTRCAAEIAAKKGNNYCGVGVAYDSKVSGIRILSDKITPEDEALSLIYGLDVNDIYSCSWGPADNGITMQGPSSLVKEAMLKGVQDGRKGKGALYVFASGNGASSGDNCNFDGYTNSIYSITVGAIDIKGLHPPYSESCSAVMTVTYSSGSGEHIHTTDINDKCSDTHGGTSAAAPLAAGLYSLVYQANPNLTWRDIQWLTVLTAVPVNEHEPGWQKTAIGKMYSHKYGYGKIDAYALVDLARSPDFPYLKPQSWIYGTEVHSNLNTSEADGVLTSKYELTQEAKDLMNFEKIEHVTVTVDIKAAERGKVLVELISPSGVVSELAPYRRMDKDKEGFPNWTFMSVAHWGEDGLGEWILKITNKEGNSVLLNSWQIKYFGESQDPEKAEKFSLTKKYDEILVNPPSSATSIIVETSSTEAVVSTSPVVETSATETDVQETTATDDADFDNEEGSYKHSNSSHVTEYLAFLLGLGFLICIIFLFTNRNKLERRQRRNRRDEYEFDLIPADDDFDTEEDQEANSQFTLDSDAELMFEDTSQREASPREYQDSLGSNENPKRTAL